MDFDTIAIVVIFGLTYLGIAMGRFPGMRLDRAGIVLVGMIALMAFQCVGLPRVIRFISFPSIIMLFSLMVVSGELQRAGFYDWMAHRIARTLDRPALFLLIMMVASGLLSAFLNNDVVCFAFAPILCVALLHKRLNPLPFIVALAIASNIGCALTLIGNAQDVVVGELAKLSFGKYLLWAALPVVASMGAAYGLILLLSRGRIHLADDSGYKVPDEDGRKFIAWQSTKGLIVTGVIVVLFFNPIPGVNLPRYLVALAAAGILLLNHDIKSRKILKKVDFQLLILFIGLFVVVGTFEGTGLAQEGVVWLRRQGMDINNRFALAGIAGVLSNLINNSAAVMLLVKLVDLTDPIRGYVLALSNTFAGNLLLIGSVANIVAIRGAQRFGVKIGFWSFARYGVPVALSSFAILFLWIWVAG